MFFNKYIDGDLRVMVICDLCQQIVADMDYAECIFPDAGNGELIPILIGHTTCTSKYEAKTGFFYCNNINLHEYIERIGKKQVDYKP